MTKTEDHKMPQHKVLSSVARSASYNMMLQLVFRLLTFGLNAIILRYISKDVLGVVNVRLTLLYTTILFMAREAFRRACLSRSNTESRWVQVVNLLWCVFPISVLYAVIFGYIWAFLLEQPDNAKVPFYRFGVFCFALSSVIECLAEPLWVVGQIFLYVRLRVLIDSVSLTARCIMTAVLVIAFPNYGLLIFSLLQIMYTCLYVILQYGTFAYLIMKTELPKGFPFKSSRDFFPQAEEGQPIIDQGLSKLVWSFFKQSFLKQILTEGERYVMTVFDLLSFSDQGVYDIINNLGSLVARFLFLPLEDSAYLFFSQSLERGVAAKKQSKENMELVTKVLKTLLKTVTIIGVTALVFGYAYSYLLLDLYGGDLLSSGSGPTLLKAYCVYVMILAINGITECFSFASMSKEEVDRYNKKMLLFSLILLASSLLFTNHLGSVGFILANCLNMLARIIHSIYHTRKFYRDTDFHPLRGIVISFPVLAVYIVSFIVTSVSEVYLCCNSGWINRVVHIIIGGMCLLCSVITIYMYEKETITFVKDMYKRRHEKSEKKTD